MSWEAAIPAGTTHHDSGGGNGHPVVDYRVVPGRQFPRYGVGRERMKRGTVPKIEEVYTDKAMRVIC